MDEKTIHNNEAFCTSGEHNEPITATTPENIPDNTITIDDVLSTEERTLPNGNIITIIKRTNQTGLIAPIKDPKTGQAFHTARVVLEPWALDPEEDAGAWERGSGKTFLKAWRK